MGIIPRHHINILLNPVAQPIRTANTVKIARGTETKRFAAISLGNLVKNLAQAEFENFFIKSFLFYSNFILAGHNGSRWNAFFSKVDKLKLGDKAYVIYKGKQYSYSLVKKYKDRQGDGVTLYRHSAKKQLTLITCSRPDYQTYYLVLVFELTNEKEI